MKSVFRNQLPSLLKLAAPVAITQLGQMLMGVVDTIMVGKLGATAVGAVSIGNAVFYAFGVSAIGMVLGLDYFVSYAYGKKDLKQCHYWLVQGVYFGILITIPIAGIIYFASYQLENFGIEPSVAAGARPFLHLMCWNVAPFILFITFRQYLQAMNSVTFVTVIMLLANVVNALFNWLFVYGNWGMPRLEVVGSGLATTLTRALLLIAIVIFTIARDSKLKTGLIQAPWRPEIAGFRKLAQLGIPASLQLFFEVAVFSLSTTLVGRLGTIELAAHTIVLHIASLTFMVPLGISAAAAVRVGQALGQNNPREAKEAGWTALILGAGFMAFCGICLLIFDDIILSIFINDFAVIELAKKILILAALFQVFDGTQTVGTGALRGLSDTKSPMYANVIGHWVLGLPVGYFLCFHTPKQTEGLWMGLTIGLISVAGMVLWNWIRKSTLIQTKA